MPTLSVCKTTLLSKRRIGKQWIVATVVLSPVLAAAQPRQVDLAALPIEQLLTLEVYSASKFNQKVSDAPSAVSIVTAADIREFGWRSLADILRSMRGMHISYDRNYSYLGARGFFRPGDYNTRFLLLVDGNRVNDAVYDQASIGSEAIIDVDLIERVEFVPGAGSSIYGANAFFGVINVITKRGRDFDGPQVSVEGGSHAARKARASYGVRGEHGGELLLSASTYRERGPDLYFPEFDTPASNNGIARRLDHDRNDSVLLKGGIGPFSLSVAHSERTKGIPTASFSQIFNDPRSHTVDSQSFVDFGYRNDLGVDAELTSRIYWGRYGYDGDYVYDYPPVTINRDNARARWWGGEVKFVDARHEGHKIVLGAEYQRDYRQEQVNVDVDPFFSYLNDKRRNQRIGVYAQDEIVLRKDLLLNAGIRYDRYSSTSDSSTNPRLALIYKPTSDTTLKVLYGTAFRPPNAYELYYEVLGPGGQKASAGLKPERIRSRELIAEHHLSPEARITASIFQNTVSDLISQTMDPSDGLMVFQNLDRARARGAEVEYEQVWSGGSRLRTSYSWQQARNLITGAILANSPRHLANFNLSLPLCRTGWRTGIEALYVGRRNTLQADTAGYWLANLTLSTVRLAPGLELSASIYNLFDRRYADPGSEEHLQDVIGQDGRTFRMKLTYAF
ncbi:MAG TPA: TonB-dependent receptor [Noviherbaspirillum sp.]